MTTATASSGRVFVFGEHTRAFNAIIYVGQVVAEPYPLPAGRLEQTSAPNGEDALTGAALPQIPL